MSAKIFSWVVVLLLSGCAISPASTTAAPDVSILPVQHSPALRDLKSRFFECAQQQNSLGLTVDERPASAFQPSLGITLRWGSPDQVDGYAAEIGHDRLVVVVHPSSPLKELSRSQIQAIYSSQAGTWAAFLQPTCEACPPDSASPLSAQTIQVLAYSRGEDIQTIFETSLNLVIEPRNTGYVPHPEAMRAEVAANPAAIGFLPARFLDSSIKELTLSDIPAAELRQPILAMLPGEPQDTALAWLGCLQESFTEPQTGS